MSDVKLAEGITYTLVTDMTNLEAKAYFREPKHYVNFELPPYLLLSIT